MKKTGNLETFNLSPKGFYEGFLLRTGKTLIQVNLPKGETETLGNVLTLGAKVTVDVEAAKSRDGAPHGVFNLIRWHGLDGHPKGKNHGARQFSGRIQKLNYTLHGEVNGGILDSGDFLHLKPKAARSVGLKVGMIVEGCGHTKPMDGGHFVIEAEEVNGMVMGHKKTQKGSQP